MRRVSLFSTVLLGNLLITLATSRPAQARACCADQPLVLDTLVEHLRQPVVVAALPQLAPRRGLGAAKVLGTQALDYHVKSHLWLMGGVHTLPTGLPLGPDASNAERTSFSQAGVGVGYTLSRAVRAITNWNTGLGRFSATPGSQFTVGVTLHYR